MNQQSRFFFLMVYEQSRSLFFMVLFYFSRETKAPAKRSQHLNATDRNIVGRNMLHAFGHPVATCWDMLRVENRTSAGAWTQHCCTNLAKRLQHHATSTDVAWKTWPFSNLSQHVTTRRNRVATRAQHVSPNNVAICCVEMLRSFGWGFTFPRKIEQNHKKIKNGSAHKLPSF